MKGSPILISLLGIFAVGGGHSDFRFCGFGYFFGSVFRFFVPKNFSFSVLVCIAVCGFSVFPKVGGKGGYGYS